MIIDTRFRRVLAKKITIEREQRLQHLAVGGPKSFEEYRENVGYLRALEHVLEWSEEIDKEIHDKE